MTKRILMKSLLAVIGLVCLLPLTGCGDEYYTGSNLTTHDFTVRKSSWEWNERYNRYEYVFDFDEIDNYIFNYGSVTGGVFITETGQGGTYTTLKSLPYVYSYYDGEIPVTEVIGFDISVGSIAFYIQTTDMERVDEFLDTYTFKITLFWEL